MLVDETSHSCTPNIRMAMDDVSILIPTWKSINEVVPVGIWSIWEHFWNSNNIPDIRRDTVMAHAEVCIRLGVNDACGVALAITAELYG